MAEREQFLVVQEPGVIGFHEYDPRPLKDGEVRIRALYSGISAGTEMTIYRGRDPHGRKKWDGDLRLFLPTSEDPRYYPKPLGYEQAGYVCEAAPDVTEEIAAGDLVYGSWDHRTEVILSARMMAGNRLGPSEDPRHGIFARSGAIALNGILDAGINVGETVAVFGAGVIGLLVMALARLSGANVMAVDINPDRLRHAEAYSDAQIQEDAALRIKQETRGRGADIVIEATGSDIALNEAIRSVAYAGRVISLGFYQKNAPGLFLGEEFHHNRVQILCSQINAVNPALSYRWDIPRLERTVMALQAAGRLELTPLITHEFLFTDAAAAYALLDKNPDMAVQVVLTFPEALASYRAGRSER